MVLKDDRDEGYDASSSSDEENLVLDRKHLKRMRITTTEKSSLERNNPKRRRISIDGVWRYGFSSEEEYNENRRRNNNNNSDIGIENRIENEDNA